MFFKLSLRNVKKSFSDYTLYFLTLTFGVCMFYVFNSIEAQKAMLQISQSALSVMKTLTWLMNIVSVFISFILGFLIVYANHFLIKRRKREFGIYLTLGMEKRGITRILITETFIIGIFSLAVGLFTGIFLSQGLSVFTAKLFEVSMESYTFLFSLSALWKAMVYFGIIFLIAIAAGTVTVSKYRLIDLINSTKQNEKQQVRSPVLTLVLFLLSVLFLGVAYQMVLQYGILTFDNRLLAECVLGAIGTFLLFASLSGFLLKVVQANPRCYLRGLNMFVVRQINNRINTAYLSMALICLMLFCTIGIFSTAIGMTQVLNRGYQDAAPFDVTVTVEGDQQIDALLENFGINLAEFADSSWQYRLYQDQAKELTVGTVFEQVEDVLPAENLEQIKENAYYAPLCFITETDYNRLLALQNKPGLELFDHQVALATQYVWANADFQECVEQYITRVRSIMIEGTKYAVYPQVITEGIVNNSSNILTLVVPDELAKNALVDQSVLCFNCGGDIAKQDRFMNRLEARQNEDEWNLLAISRNEMVAQEGGSKAIISFIGIYVGLIFLITSAAVLALQQLSQAADNRQRYAVLQKIGADDELLKRTIFKQTAIYFLIPLVVACMHSVVGIKVANDAIRIAGSLNAGRSILLTAAAVLGVYGAYFVATYIGNKNIILKGKDR